MFTPHKSPGGPTSRTDEDQVPLLLSVRQAARLLGVGTTLCWEMIHSGEMPSVRLGRRVLVPRAAIERLAQTTEITPLRPR